LPFHRQKNASVNERASIAPEGTLPNGRVSARVGPFSSFAEFNSKSQIGNPKSNPLAFFFQLKQNKDMGGNQGESRTRIRCREIMTANVRTATRETPLRDVAIMMRDGDMGAVPVVENGKLVGIVTDRDIVVRSVADGKDASAPVSYAMTTEIYSVKPDDFAFVAIRLMGDKQIRRVPVVGENGELAGIIAMADIALEMEDEREIAETLEEISSGMGFWNKK
jgi:CBS domain-containing protein